MTRYAGVMTIGVSKTPKMAQSLNGLPIFMPTSEPRGTSSSSIQEPHDPWQVFEPSITADQAARLYPNESRTISQKWTKVLTLINLYYKYDGLGYLKFSGWLEFTNSKAVEKIIQIQLQLSKYSRNLITLIN